VKAKSRFISENEILTELEKDFIKGYIQGNRSEWNREYLDIILNKCLNYGVRLESPNWYICFIGAELNRISPNYPFKLLCQSKINTGPKKSCLLVRIIKFLF
jgi:hypothetical protein